MNNILRSHFGGQLLKSSLLAAALLLFTFTSPELSSQHIDSMIEAPEIKVSETLYYVYSEGEFKEAILTKEPEMVGGKDLMETLIKLNMRYPDAAKEKRIGGTVLVSVVIDSEGQMEDAFIHEGIGGGCNDEALRAVKLMNKMGFEPGEFKGKPVTVKFDIPITFLPQ